VLYVQFTDPAAYPPLEHSARILAGQGWDVLALGIRDPKHPLSFPAHPHIRVKALRRTRGRLAVRAQYAAYVAWVALTAWWWKPACVYASDVTSAWPALVAARWAGARLVYHEHDAPLAGRGTRRLLDKRREAARRADACVVPSAGRAEALRRDTGVTHIAVVKNCPTRDEAGPERAPSAGPIVALYHGSIVPGRLPMAVIDALAAQPTAVRLVIAGYETIGYPGYVDALNARAAALGIGDRVEYLGVIPERADLLKACGRCDVGLALMPMDATDVNEVAMAGASNKAFDYLAHGLALIVSDLPDWRDMFAAAGLARVCDPRHAESIAAALRAFVDTPAEMREMGERGRRRVIAEWHYEREFAPVLDVISQGVAGAVEMNSPGVTRVA
jgi:glycosyltransferase involved in cell wall biosynthesis